jgi:hypothetical protein
MFGKGRQAGALRLAPGCGLSGGSQAAVLPASLALALRASLRASPETGLIVP